MGTADRTAAGAGICTVRTGRGATSADREASCAMALVCACDTDDGPETAFEKSEVRASSTVNSARSFPGREFG